MTFQVENSKMHFAFTMLMYLRQNHTTLHPPDDLVRLRDSLTYCSAKESLPQFLTRYTFHGKSNFLILQNHVYLLCLIFKGSMRPSSTQFARSIISNVDTNTMLFFSDYTKTFLICKKDQNYLDLFSFFQITCAIFKAISNLDKQQEN